MMLAELFTSLETRGVFKKRAPAFKSSLRHLARARGYPTLELCPVDDACRDPDRRKAALKAYFATRRAEGQEMTAHNGDNILSDVGSVFKFAEAQDLFTAPLPVRIPTTTSRRTFELQRRGTSPYQSSYGQKPRYRLKQAQWPADIQAGWQAYLGALDALDQHRRDITLRSYAYCLETYFGYLALEGDTPTWDKLFCEDLLKKFVRWHGERIGGKDRSAHAVNVVHIATAIANVLLRVDGLTLEDTLHKKLVQYSGKLKHPPALRDKERYHWTELREIERVANSLLDEGRVPFAPRPDLDRKGFHTGARRAAHFQMGLILKLLARVPLRQRNIREMQYPHNLWHNTRTDEWTLRFTGKELKVATRNGKVNIFEARLSRLFPKDGAHADDLIPTLEEFIKDFRPLLPNGKPGQSPFLFLTWRGRPFSATGLSQEVVCVIERRTPTGVKVNPHVIRDIAATALLKKTKDYDMVAVLLGNTPQMVMKHYAHLVPEQLLTEAAPHIGDSLRAR